MKSRIIAIFIGFCFLWVLLLTRATYLQLFSNERLQNLKNKQFETSIVLHSRRGNILDKNNKELAISSLVYSLYADPHQIDNPKKKSKLIAKILNLNSDFIYHKIKDKRKRFTWISRFLEGHQYQKIKDLNIKGFNFIEEWKRVYPNENLLAQTLGVVSQDGLGIEGLELKYESTLKGDISKKKVRRDARGRPINIDGKLFTENQDGTDILLSIDTPLQFYLEQELKNVINEFGAQAAMGIVLDAKTSAIRAMGTVENNFQEEKFRKNIFAMKRQKNITDIFEPGSTLKPFVVAIGLENKKIKQHSKIFCENGKFKIGDRFIHEADTHHHFGTLSIADILAYSSNIGASKIGFLLGDKILRDGLLKFGFGQRSNVDFPGEVKGVLHELPWSRHLLANISFGQGMSVTAIQLANSFAALINGGVLNKPFLVTAIQNQESGEFTPAYRKKGIQVISKETSDQMRKLLASVTTGEGTGVNAQVSGFEIGGKTGTAQKANPQGRGYMSNIYNSSFLGFIPLNDPRYVIYILVDSPVKGFYGSQVAAPVFSKIATFIARNEGLTPTLSVIESRARTNQKPQPMLAPMQISASDVASENINGSAKESLRTLTLREVLRKMNSENKEMIFQGKGKRVQMIEEQIEGGNNPESGEIKNNKYKIILKN